MEKIAKSYESKESILNFQKYNNNRKSGSLEGGRAHDIEADIREAEHLGARLAIVLWGEGR